MSSGTTTSDQQSSSVSQIPAWMSQAGEQNYAYAQDVASQPLQQYQGQTVADTAPQTQQAWNLAASSGNVGQDQYSGATAGYLNALGQTPSTITPETLAGTNLSQYMNPYTQSVINTTLPIMQQANALSQNQQANAANSANAFGGSRQGIQQGVAQAQGAQNIGQMAAQLNQANYAQAVAGAQGDISNNLAAQTSNQSAQQAKTNSDILAAQGLTNTGTALNAANLQNYNMLTSAGAGQSMQAQNQINSQIAKFQQAFNYPQTQLSTLEASLGMTPHDTSTTGDQTTTTTTPTDWANILTSSLSSAADIYKLSDKKVKKNIVSLGSDPMTGIPVKSFQYKGQPSSAPKTIGPLAQDIEKSAPGSTTRIGGVMAVPRGTLAAATPSVAHLPSFAGNKPMGALGGGLDAFMGTKKSAARALANPRAGAKALHGLANTKRGMPSVVGALGG